MSVIIRKIRASSYAYIVNREGKRVVHTYLGPVEAPEVKRIIAEKKELSTVPDRFKVLFWDTELKNIHIRKNARYIIERALEFGSLDAMNWLQRVYTVEKILDTLSISKNISNRSLIFWRLWFGSHDA